MTSPPTDTENSIAATTIAVQPESPAERQAYLPSAFQVWVGISVGIALKFAGVGQMFSDRSVQIFAWYWISNQAVIALLGGIGGALVFRAIQARKVAWMQPGHWIAVETLGLLVASLVTFPLSYLNELSFDMFPHFWAILVEQVFAGLICASWYGCIVRQDDFRQARESIAWRVFAYSSLLIYVIFGLGVLCTTLEIWRFETFGISVLFMLSHLLLVVVRAIAAIVATVQDVRSGNGRDTLHWVCLAICLAGIGMMTLLYGASLFWQSF